MGGGASCAFVCKKSSVGLDGDRRESVIEHLPRDAFGNDNVLPAVVPENSSRSYPLPEILVNNTPAKSQMTENRLDYTPMTSTEKKMFKFYCPLCMHYLKSIYTTSCCNNYVCASCALEFVNAKDALGSVSQVPASSTSIPCPHCSTDRFQLREVSSSEPLRKYSDTPQRDVNLLDMTQLGLVGDKGGLASPLKVGDSFDTMKRKMLTFEDDGYVRPNVTHPNAIASPSHSSNGSQASISPPSSTRLDPSGGGLPSNSGGSGRRLLTGVVPRSQPGGGEAVGPFTPRGASSAAEEHPELTTVVPGGGGGRPPLQSARSTSAVASASASIPIPSNAPDVIAPALSRQSSGCEGGEDRAGEAAVAAAAAASPPSGRGGGLEVMVQSPPSTDIQHKGDGELPPEASSNSDVSAAPAAVAADNSSVGGAEKGGLISEEPALPAIGLAAEARKGEAKEDEAERDNVHEAAVGDSSVGLLGGGAAVHDGVAAS